MFRKEILLDEKSYVELASRKAGERELLALVLRGPKEPGTTSLASVMLTAEEARLLAEQITSWLTSQNK